MSPMKRFLSYILAALSVAPTLTAQAPMKVTLEQIGEVAKLDASLPKYKGKMLQLTGVVYLITRGSKSVVARFPDSPSRVWVKPSAADSDYFNAQHVSCVLPGPELDKVDLLKKDLPVRVTGVFVGYSMTFLRRTTAKTQTTSFGVHSHTASASAKARGSEPITSSSLLG